MYQSHNFHNQCSYLPLSFKSEPFADHVFQTNHPEAQQPQHQGTIFIVLDPDLFRIIFFQKCIIKQWCTQTSRLMQICNNYAIQTRSTRVFPFRSIFRRTAFTIEDCFKLKFLTVTKLNHFIIFFVKTVSNVFIRAKIKKNYKYTHCTILRLLFNCGALLFELGGNIIHDRFDMGFCKLIDSDIFGFFGRFNNLVVQVVQFSYNFYSD